MHLAHETRQMLYGVCTMLPPSCLSVYVYYVCLSLPLSVFDPLHNPIFVLLPMCDVSRVCNGRDAPGLKALCRSE